MLPWVCVVKTDVRQHGIYFLNNLHPVWSSLGLWFQFFDEHTRPFLPPEFLTPSNRAFSFTWPASMQICWSKRKAQLHWIRRCCDQHGRHPQVSWLTRPPFHFFGTPIGSPWRHISDYVFCFFFVIWKHYFLSNVLIQSKWYVTIVSLDRWSQQMTECLMSSNSSAANICRDNIG